MANWLTKRIWSNKAGDLSLMQLAVVGMTLAMGLMAEVLAKLTKMTKKPN